MINSQIIDQNFRTKFAADNSKIQAREHVNALEIHSENMILGRTDNDYVNSEPPKILSVSKRHWETLEKTNQVRILINGVHTFGLVDSGASLSCVSKRFVAQHESLNKLTISRCQLPCVQGVGGDLVGIVGKMDVEIEINRLTTVHSLLVLEVMPQDVILGCDFLSANDIVINIPEGFIEIRGGVTCETIGEKPQSDFSCFGYATCDITVPPLSEALVPIHFKSKSVSSVNILLEPVESLPLRHQLVGSKMMVKQTHDGCMYQVLNATPCELKVQKDDMLCLGSDIHEESVSILLDENETYCADNSIDNANISLCQSIEEDPRFNEYVKTAADMGVTLDNSDLSETDKVSFLAFLGKNRDVFAVSLHELGSTSIHKHVIDTGDAAPIKKRFYRQTPQMREETSSQITEMLRAGIIEPSTSGWQAPVVMVKKKCGSYRCAIDYRGLNSVTRPFSWPIPRLETIFDALGEAQATVYSTIDLASGFWQVALDESSKEKTGFVTQEGVWQFRKLPFGLVNAPSAFQAVMTEVLRGMTYKKAIVYIDDILVFDRDLNSHMATLSEIFQRLRAANMKMKPSKCNWVAKEVKYLGHVLSREGIQVDQDKIKVVKEFRTPRNVKELRSFLGLANYYRKFCRHYSRIVAPLHRLLRDGEKYDWSRECEEAFLKLKNTLMTAPVLAYPDMTKEFILYTDASAYAISYILGQRDDQGRETVICYGGRGLRDSERAWPISQREGLALFEGVKFYHVYLAGKPFTAVTDHKALEWMTNIKLTETNGRLARWAIALQEYPMKVVYKQGKTHGNADSLSRREDYETPPEPSPSASVSIPSICSADAFPEGEEIREYSLEFDDLNTHTEDYIQILASSHHEALSFLEEDYYKLTPLEALVTILNIDVKNIGQMQEDEDNDFKDMIRYLRDRELPKDEKRAHVIVQESNEYVRDKGVLYHFWYPRGKGHKVDRKVKQLCLPPSLRDDVLKSYHDSVIGGHQGIERTYHKLQLKYFWLDMWNDVDCYVRSCLECQQGKVYTHGRRAPLNPIAPEEPFFKVHMDILELPETPEKYKYVLLLVDQFSKWPEAFPLKRMTAKDVAHILYTEIICRYGAFRSLITDRAKNFMSNVITELCQFFQITKSAVSAYHPASNGLVERGNSSIISALRMFANDEQDNWPELLPSIMLAYRASPATQSTNFSPYFILYGRECRLPIDVALIPPSGETRTVTHHVTDLLSGFEVTRQIVKENIEKAQAKYKKQYDKRAGEQDYNVGQRVWLFCSRRKVGRCKKLNKKFTGPYYICVKLEDNTVTLRRCVTNKLVSSRVHTNRLKPYISPDIRPTNVPVECDEELNPEEMSDFEDESPDPGDDAPAATSESNAPPCTSGGKDPAGQETRQKRVKTMQRRQARGPVSTHTGAPRTSAGPESIDLAQKDAGEDKHEEHKPPHASAGSTKKKYMPPHTDAGLSGRRKEGSPRTSADDGGPPDATAGGRRKKKDRNKKVKEKVTETQGTSPADTQMGSPIDNTGGDQPPPNGGDNEGWHAVEKLSNPKWYKGVKWYKVKWVGHSKHTWVPEYNISEKLIRDFHIQQTQKRKRKRRR